MYGADITVIRFLFQDLLPATLGNIIGGGIFMGAIYWYVYDSTEALDAIRSKMRQSFRLKVDPQSDKPTRGGVSATENNSSGLKENGSHEVV